MSGRALFVCFCFQTIALFFSPHEETLAKIVNYNMLRMERGSIEHRVYK